MENLPSYISVIFALTTAVSVLLFYIAANYSKATLVILIAWLALQSVIALSGFYTFTDTIPPRFALLVIPPFLTIVILFLTKSGRAYIDNLNIKQLTLLHTVRIVVELVLYWLYVYKMIPGLMTFEGRNFDSISGLTAPLVYYFGFVRNTLGRKSILIWNFICLALLINIVVNALLSTPFPLQQFAFDQPNIAVLYFPFIWLPCCVVPIVLLSHLAAIRQLLKNGR